ncbi:MAG TPA: bifunctional nuclease family protein [candidate division Zixibacteria bacterium]|nr:bifunctional nuclease family protein [candidate division Zixibacteria bacterium]
MLEAKVEGLALDMTTNSPVVILSPIGIEKVLPIWIGHAEAWGIAMQLSGVTSKRPLTYDLLKTVINELDARMVKIEVTELREQTFYAKIYLSCNGREIVIDARPSDSIALALKMNAKIFVNDQLFADRAGDSEESPSEEPPMPTDPESLRERLRRINPEDFGKYSL